MIKVEMFMGLVTLALWVYSLIDVINTPDSEVKHLQKMWWLLIVLFFPLVGSIAWLVAGRDRGTPRMMSSGPASAAYPEYDRPGRFASPDPAKDDEFLRQVRERAEKQRRDHAEKKRLEAEEEQRRKDAGEAE